MIPVDGPTGTYRPCHTCQAPIVSPFPDTWELELIKEGPQAGPVRTFYTPHRPGCGAPYADPDPGIAVRLRGTYVKALTFLPPLPDDALGLTRATDMNEVVGAGPVPNDRLPVTPVDPVWPEQWTPLGATDGGFSWSDVSE